ncbi:glucuronyl esterase domain-containing protein [Sorangium sp. So ce426]|uniref:glucuronyl esterase domain-containing protein n=1 Tax=unclassified Sorangium TaxID=2621164 RepID=UPI003F5BD916
MQNANAANLPIDTHALVAMIVPRGLLVLDDPHQDRLSAPAGHTTVLPIAEVYAAAPGAACSPRRARAR